ncbi:MAG: permease, partial [Bacillota bacterium]
MIREILRITVEGVVHNIWYLAAGILLAAAAEVYLNRSTFMSALSRSGWIGVVVGTAVGALTPLCSCGTAAVILALVASGVPWPPVVSFLVSSPLMSPSEYMLTAGVLGVSMANARLVTAVALGLASGGAALVMENKRLLVNTAARREEAAAGAGCSSCCETTQSAGPPARGSPEPAACCGPANPGARFLRALRTQAWFVLKFFVLFSFLGAVTQVVVPASWVEGLFGQGKSYSVVWAALAGVPLYMSYTASIPFTGSLVQMG